MSTQRDELARLIDRTINHEYSPGDDVMGADLAPAILAAGYRKPRQVTTVEELDALPVESIVRDAAGFTWDKWWDEDGSEFTWWATTGDRTEYSPKRVNLPATVLFEGSL